MEDYIKKAIEQMKRGEEKGFNTVYSATYNRVYFRAKQIMKKRGRCSGFNADSFYRGI